jgi:hypothetical protein
MKSKKFSMKLTLNKKTIANLNDNAMKEVHGGIETISACPIPACIVSHTYCHTSCATDCYSEIGSPYLCMWVCR